jgi:queuine tRNA-ribosyltransferase subunit QTRTD1
MHTLHPDITIALADIPYGTVPGTKRLTKMGDRTDEWLFELLRENAAKHPIFAAVLPIDSLAQSEYLNHLDEQADQVSGLAFYDSNILPDIPATTALSGLPRLSLDEPASPHHILRQISLGMDMFAIPFINFATDAGIALSFVFPRPPIDAESPEPGNDAVPLGINMWSPDHATSLIPLIPSCSCYACTSHHRAFIQHLLSAKEMLGWTLIQIHNHHTLSNFFAAIRKSITDGLFDEDVKTFARYYESELPAKSGQGPRQRGYHNKSRANQTKINEKSWLGDVDSLGSGNGSMRGVDAIDLEDALVPNENSVELEEKGFAEALV